MSATEAGRSGRDDEGAEGSSGESFADLVGSDTQPIARGPARVEKRQTAKSPRARQGGESSREAFRFPDPGDRFRAAARGVSDQQLLALGRGEPEPEERIDLHGARRELARDLLSKRIESARSRGIRCVLVIHGRGRNSASGEAVLRDALPSWLTKGAGASNVLAFAPAPDRLGGDGATIVLLKR